MIGDHGPEAREIFRLLSLPEEAPNTKHEIIRLLHIMKEEDLLSFSTLTRTLSDSAQIEYGDRFSYGPILFGPNRHRRRDGT